MKNILIIEDEVHLSEVICLYLTKEGYNCTAAYNGDDGQDLISNNSYDLIILDIMMPGKDGWSILRKLRRERNTPVIITSARVEEDDRVFGLELGADDYMTKPLSMRELVLRVKLRISQSLKTKEEKTSNTLTFHTMTLNKDTHGVKEDGKPIVLTPKEYSLLLFFLENRNIAFSRDKLLDSVWGFDFFGDTRTVDTHVKKLREKLSFCRDNLKTLWKVGYQLNWGDSNE